MTQMAWRVYGEAGHTQRESYRASYEWDFSEGNDTRIIEVENADKTGTHMYSILRVTRNTKAECEDEMRGQISDGVFENSKVGRVVWMETLKNGCV